MSDLKRVSLRVLEKEIQIACNPGEEEGLRKAAEYLDQKLREFRMKGGATGERLAIIAGLNIAYELINQRVDSSAQESLSVQLADMQQTIERTLNPEPEAAS